MDTENNKTQAEGTVPEIRVGGPIKGSEMVGFGFGGLAVNILSMMVSGYVIYFFTDIAGLSVAVAGTIFLVTKIIDAVTDPLVGYLTDRVVGRLGRFRPFMIYGGLFGAAMYALLFTKVSFDSPVRIAYYAVIYILWSCGYTLMVVPYHAAVAVLSNNRDKRNIIIMVGKLISVPAGLCVSYAHPMVAFFGRGNDAAGWAVMTYIMAAVIIAGMLVCAYSIRRFDTKDIAREVNRKKDGTQYPLRERIGVIVHNKALMMLVLAYATNSFAAACINTNYFAKYVINDLSFITKVGTVATFATIPVFLIAPLLAKKFNKKDIFLTARLLHFIFPLTLLTMGTRSVILLMVTNIISRLSAMLINSMAFMMLPDCVDFGYKVTGIVSAGLITSTYTFGNKVSTALGGAVSSWVLQGAGFTANETQSAAVITAIIGCMVLPTIISDICSCVGMIKYPIKEHSERVRKEAEKKAEP